MVDYRCKIKWCKHDIIPISDFVSLSESDRKEFYKGWAHYAEDEDREGYIAKECLYQNENGKDCTCKYPQPDECSQREFERLHQENPNKDGD